MPSGLQSLPVVSVVLPRMSLPPRTIRNFSAPGFNGGAVVPAGRPAKLYTPVRSGFPSGVRVLRAVVAFVGLAVAPLAAAAVVPCTVTTMLRDGPPRIVNV